MKLTDEAKAIQDAYLKYQISTLGDGVWEEGAFKSGWESCKDLLAAQGLVKQEDVVELLYSHYKNNGGFTRIAATFIEK
jgi:hypothetical protein